MERLKVADSLIYITAKAFTFQYGEIKSVDKATLKTLLQSFTFQYGEIKSRNEGYDPKPVKAIYIPVWRD